jgi:hypothetical protein
VECRDDRLSGAFDDDPLTPDEEPREDPVPWHRV